MGCWQQCQQLILFLTARSGARTLGRLGYHRNFGDQKDYSAESEVWQIGGTERDLRKVAATHLVSDGY